MFSIGEKLCRELVCNLYDYVCRVFSIDLHIRNIKDVKINLYHELLLITYMNIAIYMNNFDLLSYYAHYYNINILKYNNIDDDKCEIANDIFVNRLLNMNDYYIDILSSEYKKYNSLPMKTPILITYIKEHINESFVKNIIRVFIACIYKSKYHKIKFDKNDIIIIIKNGLQELITQVIA